MSAPSDATNLYSRIILTKRFGLSWVGSDERGIVVVAPLIVVTVLLVTVVVAGWLLYPEPPRYVVADLPMKHVAASPGVVVFGGRGVRRLEEGDTVWAVRAGNGVPVIFPDSTGTGALGIGQVLLVPIVPDAP